MRVDFHIHTNISDGGLSFEDILKKCDDSNVKIISITDHNSFKEISNVDCQNQNVKVIRGAELDVKYSKTLVFHMLLYDFDIKSKLLNKYYLDNRRYEIKSFLKKIKMIENKYNFTLDKNKVKSFINNNNYFDRICLNRLLVYCDICDNVEEAYKKYTYFIPKTKRKSISLKRLFKIAKDSNGIVSLAHPMNYGLSMDIIKKIILKLKHKYNLMVVEAINNHQTLEEQKELIDFCIKNKLYISAGSDSHFKLSTESEEKIGLIQHSYINSDDVSFYKIIVDKEIF